MSPRRTQIAIIGGGLAGHTAARAVHQAGADALMICPTSPGITALWGGLGQVFGPSSDFPSRSVGLFGQGATLPTELRVARADRFFTLTHSRQFHPYQRLELEQDAVAETAAQALEILGYSGITNILDEIVFPSAAGAPFPADLAATSVVDSAIMRGERVGVVACPALADWYPQRLIETLNSLEGPDALLIEAAPLTQLSGHMRHSAVIAAQLDTRLDAEPMLLIDALAPLVERREIDLLILPPCIGYSSAKNQEWMQALRASLPCRVAESAAARNSIHGWRLDRFLRAENPIDCVKGRATHAQIDASGVSSIQTEVGSIQADAYILATGRWMGRGLPGAAPLRESILNADLWMDGAPITDPDHTWLPHLLERQVWQDHPYFRAGLATDRQLRPLDPNGEPIADNVFAAGRVLAGYNAIWDGTTEGVDLITGYLAAKNALAKVGLDASDQNHNDQNHNGQNHNAPKSATPGA